MRPNAIDIAARFGDHARLMIFVSVFNLESYMSILNKVENAYLTILRLVALTGATLALILAIGLGISAASKLLTKAPKDEPSTELITAQNKPSLDAFIAQNKSNVNTPEKTDSPNKPEDEIKNSDLDSAAMNFSNYYMGVFEGSTLDHNKVREAMIKGAITFHDETKNAYFKSLNEFSAELLKKIAEQKTLFTATQAAGQDVNTAPGFIDIDSAIKWHFYQFSAMAEKNKAEAEQKQQEYASTKESGTQELYIAAGSFGAFLLVVFIFIIIKIERNLRGISAINSVNEL